MPIRKCTSPHALDPNHGFGLPLYHAYYDAACLLLKNIDSTASKKFTDTRLEGLLKMSAQSSLLPALYLVRHTIELALKEVLGLKDIADGKESSEVRRTHNLQKLWHDLRQAVSHDFAEEFKKGGDTLSTLLESIETPIKDLESVDPNPGVNFRYPEALLEKKLFPVNICDVRRQLDVVIEILQELEKAYTALIDYKND
jgi:hypothetical protein